MEDGENPELRARLEELEQELEACPPHCPLPPSEVQLRPSLIANSSVGWRHNTKRVRRTQCSDAVTLIGPVLQVRIISYYSG